jgi:hypothetical protein
MFHIFITAVAIDFALASGPEDRAAGIDGARTSCQSTPDQR